VQVQVQRGPESSRPPERESPAQVLPVLPVLPTQVQALRE